MTTPTSVIASISYPPTLQIDSQTDILIAPVEIVKNILTYLDPKSLLACTQVCKSLDPIAREVMLSPFLSLKARQIALTIEDPKSQVLTLLEIAKQLSQFDPRAAQETLQAAKIQIDQIQTWIGNNPNPEEQISQIFTLTHMMDILCDLDRQMAKEVLKVAVTLVQQIHNPIQARIPQIQIILVGRKIDLRIAKELQQNLIFQDIECWLSIVEIESLIDLDSAIKTVSESQDQNFKSQGYSKIANVLRQKDPKRAKEMLGLALEAANLSGASRNRVLAALIQVEYHLDPQSAIHRTTEISDEFTQGQTFSMLVNEAVHHDLQHALEITDLIESPFWRDSSKLEVIKQVVKNDSRKAQEIAKTMTELQFKLQALLLIAEARVQFSFEAAKAQLEEVKMIMQSCRNEPVQPRKFLFGSRTNRPTAVESKQTIPPAWKKEIFPLLLRVQSQIEPHLAKAFANEIEVFESRILALLQIAENTNFEEGKKILEDVKATIYQLKNDIDCLEKEKRGSMLNIYHRLLLALYQTEGSVDPQSAKESALALSDSYLKTQALIQIAKATRMR